MSRVDRSVHKIHSLPWSRAVLWFSLSLSVGEIPKMGTTVRRVGVQRGEEGKKKTFIMETIYVCFFKSYFSNPPPAVMILATSISKSK